MKILLVGSKMDMISGHSRPAFELMGQFMGMGHQVRMVSTVIDNPAHYEANSHLLAADPQLSQADIVYRFNTRGLAFSKAAAAFIEEQLQWSDVVHAFSMMSGSLIARINRRTVGRPIICTLGSNYGLTWRDLGLPFLTTGYISLARARILANTLMPRFFYRKLLEPFDLVHSWTNYLTNKARNWGIGSERMATTGIGVDLSRFKRAAEMDFGGHPVFLYFGSLTELRGVNQLIKAFRALKKSVPSAKLVIASTGFHGIEQRLVSKVYGLAKDESIFMAGFSQDIGGLLSSVDAIVLPFRTTVGYLQPPLVVLEAMASGNPVISTTTGAVPEIIRHEDTGLLVEPGDVKGLEMAMRRMVDADFANEIGLRGKRYVEAKHSWSIAAERVATIYVRAASNEVRSHAATD